MPAMFVAHFADDFFNDVFERDHAFGAAVFVEHDCELVVLFLKQLKQPIQRHILGHKQGRMQKLAEFDGPAEIVFGETDL